MWSLNLHLSQSKYNPPFYISFNYKKVHLWLSDFIVRYSKSIYCSSWRRDLIFSRMVVFLTFITNLNTLVLNKLNVWLYFPSLWKYLSPILMSALTVFSTYCLSEKVETADLLNNSLSKIPIKKRYSGHDRTKWR